MSLDRLEYDAETGTVTYTSDKADGPTAGRHTFEAADFIALLIAHIPDKGQVLQRDYGYYANRTRGARREAEDKAAASRLDGSEPTVYPTIIDPADVSRGDARRPWAELSRLL